MALCVFASVSSVQAHDAWIAAKWNQNKTQILLSVLVAEHFPHGDPIKGLQRFVDPRAYVLGGQSFALTGDPVDSTLLGSLPLSTSIVIAAEIRPREITFERDLAERYLIEEVGLSKEESSQYLTTGVQQFEETYSRYLKTIVATHSQAKDSTLGLPLEIVLMSWRVLGQGSAEVEFRLLDKGRVVAHAPIRVLTGGKMTVVRTNEYGVGQATVDPTQPILLAHIQMTKLDKSRFKSLWTNLATYLLKP